MVTLAIPELLLLTDLSGCPEKDQISKAAITTLQHGGQEVVHALVLHLNCQDEEKIQLACFALGRLGPLAAPAVTHVARLLQSQFEDVRGIAAESLGDLGKYACQAVPAMESQLEQGTLFKPRLARN